MKEALLKIKGNQKIEVNFDIIVKKIQLDNLNDLIEIDAEEKDNLQNIFKNLTLEKGDIFPIPKINNILNVKELFIDFDTYLSLRLFIKADIKSNQLLNNNIISNIEKEEFCFKNNGLIECLKNVYGIKENLFSSIFRIKSIEQKYIHLLCLKDLNTYIISPKNIKISPLINEFILIANYILENNNEIKLNDISIIKKLNEEKLFQFYSNRDIFGDKLDLYKIIDINENNYFAINSKKIIFRIQKEQNLEKLKINICQLLLVDKFKTVLKKYDLKFNLTDIILDPSSIIYISKQDIYFHKSLIPINLLTVIRINFLDYDINNLYDIITIKDNKFAINNKEIYCIISNTDNNNFDYYSVEINLQNSVDTDIKKIFYFFLYRGILNKINAFVNNKSERAYFIEYFFMSVDANINENITKTNVEINGKQYKLNIFDTFQSTNRKRFNVLNAPFQNIVNFKEEILISKRINSIQICKIFYKKTSLLYGIFNIKDAILKESKDDNSYFDKYYEEFGDIHSYIDSNKNFPNKIKEKCFKIFSESKINKSGNFINFALNSYLTHSQFRTRLGLIICYYIYKAKNNEEVDKFLGLYYDISLNIRSKNLTYLQRLRIIIFYLRKKMKNKMSLNDILFFSSLSKKSPYYLAKELNLQEINNLNEYSRYFTAYLQIDSFFMYNYLKNEESYSFSLEPLFVMKYLMSSTYEDFIFTTCELGDEYAYYTNNENITVINEVNVFNNKITIIKDIDDVEESKNLALPLSFEFRHEKNAHEYKTKRNLNELSPILFYKDGKFNKIKDTNGNIIQKGESGRMVESFLTEDKYIIWQLKNFHKFGELLDYRFFIDRDFSKLFKKMEEIKNKKEIKRQIEKELACEVYDKKENFKKNDTEEIIERRTKQLEKEGTVKLGDLHYTKFEFERIKNKKQKKYN